MATKTKTHLDFWLGLRKKISAKANQMARTARTEAETLAAYAVGQDAAACYRYAYNGEDAACRAQAIAALANHFPKLAKAEAKEVS